MKIKNAEVDTFIKHNATNNEWNIIQFCNSIIYMYIYEYITRFTHLPCMHGCTILIKLSASIYLPKVSLFIIIIWIKFQKFLLGKKFSQEVHKIAQYSFKWNQLMHFKPGTFLENCLTHSLKHICIYIYDVTNSSNSLC